VAGQPKTAVQFTVKRGLQLATTDRPSEGRLRPPFGPHKLTQSGTGGSEHRAWSRRAERSVRRKRQGVYSHGGDRRDDADGIAARREHDRLLESVGRP
jgi:hypothetical protein